MSTGTLEKEKVFPFDSIFFQDQIERIIEQIIPIFKRTVNQHAVFHLFYFFLGLVEITLFLFFLTEVVKNSYLAVTLAFLFLTFFSYFVFRIYLQHKKVKQLEEIHAIFINTCEDLIGFREDVPEHRVAIATACTKCAGALRGLEEMVWNIPKMFSSLKISLKTLSSWWHHGDVHMLREKLLLTAVDQHLELVKMEPTDLQVHAALANAYVTLSGIYANPSSDHCDEEKKSSYRKEMEAHFRQTAQRAIEELKIIDDFAPHDPWVHLQLAYSYRDLGMPEEVIREYEKVVELAPEDDETLLQLGLLYFQQGQSAQGLKVYEELKNLHYGKAEQLIHNYK